MSAVRDRLNKQIEDLKDLKVFKTLWFCPCGLVGRKIMEQPYKSRDSIGKAFDDKGLKDYLDSYGI
jgi:hypothetical protein